MAYPFFSASQYVSYWLRAKGPHSLHSPFLFDLYNQVIKPSSNTLSEIEGIRQDLLRDDQIIEAMDFKSGKSRRSTISGVARHSLSQPKFSNFLRLLGDQIEARTVLETGTSLGINALYLSRIKTARKVVTLEGSEVVHGLAKKVLHQSAIVEAVRGDLYEQFEMLLVKHHPDMVFLDADHRGTAIDFCIAKINLHLPDLKCLIIHDIHWSRDMKSCWDRLVRDERYALTLDVFQAGILFPNYPIEKQHFTLKF